MILAIDVYYLDNRAKSVGLLFENWKDNEPKEIVTAWLDGIQEYESGNFYKRELPCILKLLEEIDLSLIEVIVIDGYVFLDDEKKLGLGGYLYQTLQNKLPVIGVAKHSFHDNKENVREVYRGDSKKPLYVSCIGIDLTQAANQIKDMDGTFRIPSLLKRLDQETKK